MYRPQHIVAKIGKEKPRIINVILAQFLLLGKTVQNKVNKCRDPSRGSPLREIARSSVECRKEDSDYSPNWEAMSFQGVEDGSLGRAREGKSSERGGREVRV